MSAQLEDELSAMVCGCLGWEQRPKVRNTDTPASRKVRPYPANATQKLRLRSAQPHPLLRGFGRILNCDSLHTTAVRAALGSIQSDNGPTNLALRPAQQTEAIGLAQYGNRRFSR